MEEASKSLDGAARSLFGPGLEAKAAKRTAKPEKSGNSRLVSVSAVPELE